MAKGGWTPKFLWIPLAKTSRQVKPPDLIPEARLMAWFVQMTLALNYMWSPACFFLTRAGLQPKFRVQTVPLGMGVRLFLHFVLFVPKLFGCVRGLDTFVRR